MEKDDDYFENIESACSKEGDFIAIIKQEKASDFLEKTAKKGEVLFNMPGVMVRAKIDGIEVSVLRTGRVLIKGIGDLNKARAFLKKIAY